MFFCFAVCISDKYNEYPSGTINQNQNRKSNMNKTFSHSFESKSLSAQHTPGDEHLFLDVSQKLRVILAGQIQTLSMETQDLQTVQHVE